MNRSWSTCWRRVFARALLILAWCPGLPAARAAEDRVVELPPMIVSENAKSRPWRYVTGEHLEVISKCDDDITRAFLERTHELDEILRQILPEEFQYRSSLPKRVVLVDVKSAPEMSRALLEQFLRPAGQANGRPARTPDGAREEAARASDYIPGTIHVIPNLELSDVDGLCLFAMADERTFDGEKLVFTPGHLRLLLEYRVPALPPWFVQGYLRLFNQLTFSRDGVVLPRLVWQSETVSKHLRQESDAARELLPAATFFAASRLEGAAAESAPAWKPQAELFIRWCLETPERRASLWRFVSECREHETEAALRACFGFGYADWRNILSDYLPVAVTDVVATKVEHPSRPERYAFHDATPAEIGRVKGEWERLAAVNVRSRYPQYASQYFAAARRTFETARERNGLDPDVYAAWGLLELDGGDSAAARPLLEAAAAGGRMRPRVYVELAAMRLNDAMAAPSGASGRLSSAQVDIVLDQLALAQAQLPPIANGDRVMLEALALAEQPPTPERLRAVEAALTRFPKVVSLSYFAAVIYLAAGDVDRAVPLAVRGVNGAPTDAGRARFTRLLATLRRLQSPPPRPATAASAPPNP